MIAKTLRKMADRYYTLSVLAEGRGETALAASHRRVWQMMRDEAVKLEAEYPEDVPCEEPHQGCGCNLDASQGSHTGPCEYDVTSDDGHVGCIKCLSAIRESKR